MSTSLFTPPSEPSAIAPPSAPAVTTVASVAPRQFSSVKTLPPLSPLTYYRRNVTRTLPVGGAIVISVFLIAAIVTLLNSVNETITTNYGFVRRLSILTTQLEKDVPPQVLNKVKRVPHIGRIIPGIPYFMTLRTVFGEMPVPIYGVDEKEMPILATVSGNHLAAGKWPQPNAPEIVMSRSWANNFGKGVGQWVDFKNDRFPSLPDKQKIVGLLDGGEDLALTERSYLELELPEPVIRTSYMMIPSRHSELPAMNAGINELIDNYQQHGFTQKEVRFLKFYTFEKLVQEFSNSIRFLYKFLAIADGLVIGAVALMGGFLANIYFEQRLGEFGLLSAFGFRRERLAKRLVIEIGMLVALGWVVGLALTWTLFRLLDVYYMSPQGLILAPLDHLAILYTLPTPLIVGVASLATVLLRLYKMDPIEIMERR